MLVSFNCSINVNLIESIGQFGASFVYLHLFDGCLALNWKLLQIYLCIVCCIKLNLLYILKVLCVTLLLKVFADCTCVQHKSFNLELQGFV